MSCKVNDVKKREPRDNNGNATLMAQGALQGLLMKGANYEFTPILISIKKTRDFGNNVNQTSKKLKCSRVFTSLCFDKKTWKTGRKTIHHELVQAV